MIDLSSKSTRELPAYSTHVAIKALDQYWFTNIGIVGIVLIENSLGEQSARIGTLEIATTPEKDALIIASNGAKLSYRMAKAFFPYIKKNKYKKT